MSRTVSSISLLLSLIWLAACGFEPVFAERSGGGAGISVRVEVPGDTREAYVLRRALEQALTAPGTVATTTISARVTIQREPALIGRDGRADRYNLVVGVPYRLSKDDTPTPLDEGIVTAYVSYTMPESDFAAFTAERKAVDEGTERAVQDIRLRVLDRLARVRKP